MNRCYITLRLEGVGFLCHTNDMYINIVLKCIELKSKNNDDNHSDKADTSTMLKTLLFSDWKSQLHNNISLHEYFDIKSLSI